jgi:DNA primase
MNIWDEIKNRITCRDIAQQYGVNLSKKKAVCPFCKYKKNPSFYVTDDYFKGIFDQLLAEQAGFNCIATAGSGGKINIHKGIKKILLCFDGDDRGREYIEKYALDFYEQGANVSICLLDEGTDLADFIRGRGKIEELKKINILEHYMEKLSGDTTNKEIKSKVYRIVNKFDDKDE